MMIFSLVAMIGLEKCCITSACLQWLCHSGERIVARGPLVFFFRAKIVLAKQQFCIQTKMYSINYIEKIVIFLYNLYIFCLDTALMGFKFKPSYIRDHLNCHKEVPVLLV